MRATTRSLVRTSVLPIVLTAVWCSAVRAEPIQITAGSLQLAGASAGATGTVSLIANDRGFTLSARVGTSEGIFGPWEQCQAAPNCAPGAPIDLHALWVGLGSVATVTLDGLTFANVGSLASDDSAVLEFTGAALAPAFAGGAASLSAPFEFEGRFVRSMGGGATLVGRGMATLFLTQSFGPNEGLPPAWRVLGARYDFAALTPTPEPATFVLTAVGLVGLAARRRRRTQC
jgi:hypothetical protein